MAFHDPPDIDWGRVFGEAVALAMTVTTLDAEDVVQQGMKLHFAGEASWDSTGKRTLPHHLVAEGLNALADRARTERRRRHPGVVSKVVLAFDRPPQTPEDDCFEAEEALRRERLIEAALGVLEQDPEAREILLLALQGVHQASDQAERSGMHIAGVRNAHKRIRRCLEALAERDKEAVGS